jgi:alkylhydroperoxidase family enzyme
MSEVVQDFAGRLYTVTNNAPALARAYREFGAAVLSGSGLDPALRELVTTVVLEACGARKMAERHGKSAVRLGIPESKLRDAADFETAVGFSDFERAVLRFALESARAVHVDEETFAALRRWLDLRAQTALTLLVAYYAGLAHIAVPLDAESD